MNRAPVAPPSSPQVRERMQRVRRRDTGPELRLRSELHARGLRYRVDAPFPFLARHRADVVFAREKVAIYVDGCFWHFCPDHGSLPTANRDWWRNKFARIRDRDAVTDQRLRDEGWDVVRVWEHEDAHSAADRVQAVLEARRK